MSKVCIGCGVTTDDDGNLIAAVSGGTYEDSYTCGASNGGKVYCSSATGKLVVDPPPQYREWKFINEISGNVTGDTDDLTDFGVTQAAAAGDNVVKDFTATAGTVTNPSSCRPMQLWIEIGIQHALFTVDAGGQGAGDSAIGDIQIDALYSLTGGITALNQAGGHQHWGAQANGGGGAREIFRFDTTGAFFDLPSNANGTSPYILAPGASVTLTSLGRLTVIRYATTGNGRVTLVNWRNTIRVRGWSGA